MLPALVHDPGAFAWDELHQLQDTATLTGVNGSVLTAHNGGNPFSGGVGAANPLAVRFASPWGGTRGASFRGSRGFLALEKGASPTGDAIGRGAITLAFCVAPSVRTGMTGDYGAVSTLLRWGRNRYLEDGTVQGKDWQAWEGAADNTLVEIALGNYDGSNGYIAKTLILSHENGSDSDFSVRTARRDVHGAPQAGAITHVLISRSDDAAPIWTVAYNGRVCVRSDQKWPGTYTAPVDNVPPSNGGTANSRYLLGESFNGLLWTVGFVEREVTGLDVGVGNLVSGEALTIYNSIPWEAAGLLRRAA